METIFTYENLYKAYLECRKMKRKTINALKFEYELENNLYKLLKELKSRRYKPGRSTCFVVTKPTVREIFAADFRDRVVHHLFVNELIEIAEKTFCFDSFACRTGKGIHRAVRRLKQFIPKITENYKKEAYYLQLDIKSFFMSIDQRILFGIIEKYIAKSGKSNFWRNEIRWLAKIIVFNKTTKNYLIKGNKEVFKLLPKGKSLFDAKEFRGLPIGNLTSQFFANLYLNEVDQFIKRELKCRFYVRYVDDFIILNSNPSVLEEAALKVDGFLGKKLNLGLSHQKTKLKDIKEGIDFLGYQIKPDYTLVRKKVVKRFWEKFWRKEQELKLGLDEDPIMEKKIKEMAASYFGHFKHANAYFLGKSLNSGLTG